MSCLAPVEDSRALTFFKVFNSSAIHMSSSLCFPFQSYIYSFSFKFQVLFTKKSNKAQDVKVLLFLFSATVTE